MLLKDLNALDNHKNLLDIEGNDIIQGLSNTPKSLPP
jgi:hypothetical protein